MDDLEATARVTIVDRKLRYLFRSASQKGRT